jgi:hypothetical protein
MSSIERDLYGRRRRRREKTGRKSKKRRASFVPKCGSHRQVR